MEQFSNVISRPISGTYTEGSYRQRSPKNSVFYQVVSENYHQFISTVDNALPDHVEVEFDQFLKCGLLEHGFVQLNCKDCKENILVPLSCKKRGFCSSCIGKRMSEGADFFVTNVIPHVPVRQWVLSFPMPARFWMARNPRLMQSLLNIFTRTIRAYYRESFYGSSSVKRSGYKVQPGSITVIQRFGGALNLNIHFHTLFLDGVYVSSDREQNSQPVFIPQKPIQSKDVENLLKTVQKRMIRHLIKRGLISKYENDPVPDLNEELTLLDSLQGSSVLGRIGTGENQGSKVRRVGSFGTESEKAFTAGPMSANLAGFSLHAGTYVRADDRERLESLCRYLLRPPVSEKRLRRRNNGEVLLELKSEWNDGTKAMIFTPHEFIEKLIAIIPPPRIHGVRFHGILAPSATDRKKVVPAKIETSIQGELFELKYKKKMKRSSWRDLLKRTFQIDLNSCFFCGGEVKYQKVILKKSEILEVLAAAGLSPTPE